MTHLSRFFSRLSIHTVKWSHSILKCVLIHTLVINCLLFSLIIHCEMWRWRWLNCHNSSSHVLLVMSVTATDIINHSNKILRTNCWFMAKFHVQVFMNEIFHHEWWWWWSIDQLKKSQMVKLNFNSFPAEKIFFRKKSWFPLLSLQNNNRDRGI